MDYEEMINPITGYTLDKEFAVFLKDFDVSYLPEYKNYTPDFNPIVEDGFVWMETLTGQRIAMHYPKFAEVYEDRYTSDCDAIIQFVNYSHDTLPDHVGEIILYGGALDYLYDADRPIAVLKDKDILTVCSDGTLEYNIPEENGKQTRKIIIGKHRLTKEANDFNSYYYEEVYLKFVFLEPVSLAAVSDYYRLAVHLVRFMTKRFDVSFRSIKVKSTAGRVKYADGTVYIKQAIAPCMLFSGTCITFQDLGWTLINLLAIFTRMIKEKGKRNRDYSLDFISSSADNGTITNEIICSISGSLEYEVSRYKDIEELRNQEIDNFAKAVRAYIKDNYKSYNVPESALNLIFGSTQNWSLSAAERFIALEQKYKEAVDHLKARLFQGEYYNVGAFVKHRNQLMHRSSSPPSIEICVTAMILRGLVYCSILGRAGVEIQLISKLCKEGRIE